MMGHFGPHVSISKLFDIGEALFFWAVFCSRCLFAFLFVRFVFVRVFFVRGLLCSCFGQAGSLMTVLRATHIEARTTCCAYAFPELVIAVNPAPLRSHHVDSALIRLSGHDADDLDFFQSVQA